MTEPIEILVCKKHSNHLYNDRHPCPECAGTLVAPEEMDRMLPEETQGIALCLHCEKRIPLRPRRILCRGCAAIFRLERELIKRGNRRMLEEK